MSKELKKIFNELLDHFRVDILFHKIEASMDCTHTATGQKNTVCMSKNVG